MRHVTYTKDPCQTSQCVMSHKRISRVKHLNDESCWSYMCHTHERQDSFVCLPVVCSRHTFERQDSFVCVTWLIHSYVWHVKYMNDKSCYTYECVCHIHEWFVSLIWMSHVTHFDRFRNIMCLWEFRHMYIYGLIHVIFLNESCLPVNVPCHVHTRVTSGISIDIRLCLIDSL